MSWLHQDPAAKSKRVTDGSGNVVSTLELDPWGGETDRSSNQAFQPRRFTTYERDGNASDEAMHRRYNRWHSQFDQPDPYGGSYEITDPQSFNRYAYVQNDPVNFVDPSGLDEWRAFNCATRADLGIGVLDWLDGWQGPCGGGGGGGGDGRGGGGGGGSQTPAPGFDRDLGEPPPNQPACDLKLAALFGGLGAKVSTGLEPSTLLKPNGTPHQVAGVNRFNLPPGHDARVRPNAPTNTDDRGGIIHIYGSPTGLSRNNGLYVPRGFTGTEIEPGPNNRMAFTNTEGLTIVFAHVGSTRGPNNNTMGSQRIGNIGGPGGGTPGYGYFHSHIYFLIGYDPKLQNTRSATRVDPRTIFCKEFGF